MTGRGDERAASSPEGKKIDSRSRGPDLIIDNALHDPERVFDAGLAGEVSQPTLDLSGVYAEFTVDLSPGDGRPVLGVVAYLAGEERLVWRVSAGQPGQIDILDQERLHWRSEVGGEVDGHLDQSVPS